MSHAKYRILEHCSRHANRGFCKFLKKYILMLGHYVLKPVCLTEKRIKLEGKKDHFPSSMMTSFPHTIERTKLADLTLPKISQW